MYPHFYLGLFFGFLFAICSAMKFITIRAIGDNIHSSLKNYYFGLLSTLAALIACSVTAPNFFKPWLIGTPEYPLNKYQFYSSLIVGFFGWTSQESLSLALGSIKSGTTAAFQNVAIIMSFLIDVLYFQRTILITDYVGAAMIIVFTTYQGYLSNAKDSKQIEKRRQELMDA